ncbi:MAG TPA: ATP-binding protein [Blastocatellia bacterium]|nr:ATP-binding protein [Blastocatellia bacterium]
MATTATADKTLVRGSSHSGRWAERLTAFRPTRGVRFRQISLITLLVAGVAAATTIANIAYLTGVIVSRTREQVGQLSTQLRYAVQTQLAYKTPVEKLSEQPYAALAASDSGVRELMVSTMAASQGSPIIYLYATDEQGRIVTDESGRSELAANTYKIGDDPSKWPDLGQLASQNAYTQLARVFTGPAVYEYRDTFQAVMTEEKNLVVGLHIGVSTSAVRRELWTPITTSLFIGLLAILGAGIVALTSANLLLKPLAAISTSIDQIGAGEHGAMTEVRLPQDQMVSGVAARLRQLGERLAGERSELQIMRGRLRQVISHLDERLLLINREGRVILASPDAETLLGKTGIELTGLPIDEVLGQTHPLVQLAERAFATRRSIARTELNVPVGPRSRQLLVSVQYIEDAGEPVGALITLRDYESFQKFESQWDLSKKLADLGRITSGIAHEVKNPLNAMVIHLEILRSKLQSGTGNPKPHIAILDSEIKRLDRVVQTFLNFTRPLEVSLEPLDVNAIVSQVVALASTEARERGVGITMTLADGPLLVKGDSDLLTQTLLNVIMNGCQAMPQGGPLRVATFRREDGTARITISDSGTGIPAEARDHIFKLFYTTKREGSGIGLAQAFRAVQLHNGTIRFASQTGVGTTFEIVLPGSRSITADDHAAVADSAGSTS